MENLQKAVTSTKQAYAESLRELERISEEIHFKRAGLGLREPGVGAELASLPVYELELDRCDRRSMGSMSAGDDSEPLDEYEERVNISVIDFTNIGHIQNKLIRILLMKTHYFNFD